MKIGDKIWFGSYEWRILDVQNDIALIVTECIVEQRPYHDIYEEITWSHSEIRKYLNNDFYNKFSDLDKAKIIPTLNKNLNNQWYGTLGGENTVDILCQQP